MLKQLLTFITMISFQMTVFGQLPRYLQLIDSATKNSTLFVGAQPVNNFGLDSSETTSYEEVLKEECNCAIERRTLAELITRSKKVDTTYWTDNEMKHALIVKSRDGDIKLKDAVTKFKPSGRKQIKTYRKQINKYNETNSWDRNICYYSRPVFDDSKQFALVCFHNAHSGLLGGGLVSLFHFTGETWQRIGIIKRWHY